MDRLPRRTFGVSRHRGRFLGGSIAVHRMAGIVKIVKGFRTPASHWREGVHRGRCPKSLEGGNRGGSLRRRRCRAMGM